MSGSVLILSTSVNGGTSSMEYQQATALGLTATVATPSTWDAMTESQFASYSALMIGDPSSAGSCAVSVPSDALSTASTWGPAVTGDVAVLGTAPVLGGGTRLIKDAIAYAASSGSGTTGLYVSLNCEYSSASAGTSVPLLADVDGGGFTVTGQGSSCPSNAGTVNAWQALADAPFNGLTSATVGPWSSPACLVQETFNSWPAGLAGLAYDTAASPATFTAADGATGQAYVLAGMPVSSSTAALTQSAGGQIPAGATAGGAGNPAAPGVNQPSSGGVNTENGDYSTSNTDLSIPTFGPPLDFTRTYDAQVAQQETQTGTPGPLGYGWTDNWASSLSSVSPVVGDVYSLDGLAATDGNGGPALNGPLDYPDMSIQNNGNVYISDTAGNRIEEIPGSTGTQWGMAMTAGDMYTIAGSPTGAYGQSENGTPDEAGVQGATASSLLNHPEGLSFDPSGDLYIADTGNNRVMEIPVSGGTQWGIPMTGDELYTVAGSASGTAGHSGDNGAATSALLNLPVSVQTDNGTQLYISDSGNNRIQEVARTSHTEWNISMTANDMYTIAGSASGTAGFSGDGGLATSALLNNPGQVALDGSLNLYIPDTNNNREREVSSTTYDISEYAGDGQTLASMGDGGPAVEGELFRPAGQAEDASGNIYISDMGNNRIQEIAATNHTQWGIAMTAGDVYTVAGSKYGLAGFSGDGGPATSALLNTPMGIAVDAAGDLFIADQGNNRIREVNASTGDITT
jgi:hypothetical protein